MARVMITGSADGLGLMAAQLLLGAGHDVTFHARSAQRADDLRQTEPRAKSILAGDLSSLAETRGVAAQANDLGRYDAVIHNATVSGGYFYPQRPREPSPAARDPGSRTPCWTTAPP